MKYLDKKLNSSIDREYLVLRRKKKIADFPNSVNPAEDRQRRGYKYSFQRIILLISKTQHQLTKSYLF